MITFLSRLAETSQLTLPNFVRLIRGETTYDPRLNKDLYELPGPPTDNLSDEWGRWNEVVRHGVIPEWLPHRPPNQARRPRNHGSINDHLPQVWRHIRKGQKDGRYLVLKASMVDHWAELFISPVGVVNKAGAVPLDIRLINDYSFPEGESVNDYTDRSHLPGISYNPPGDIARRIFTLRRDHAYARILLMLGDVAGAFRHVPVNADNVHMFAFIIGEYLVIDLSCGFGWRVAGSGYDALAQSPCQGLFWCDDHTCIEIDDGPRCFIANLALRRAMATVLGPTAINERKFTDWNERGRALGYEWNTQDGTVTIPADKILRDQRNIAAILAAGTVTKTSALSLLGSLRHITTCCPPARAFFQRVQDMARRISRYGRRHVTAEAMEDLKWLQLILQNSDRFNSIPVDHFGNMAAPTVHVQMDASNDGLCALEPSLRQFIRVKFTEAEQQMFTTDMSVNSINVRELQSAVLAALHWGPIWSARSPHRPIHVCFWIDNAVAVSWTQRRTSRQPLAQLYNRLIALAEFNYSLVCTAEHVPGVENIMADAGSRAWSNEDPLFDTWTNLSNGWTQITGAKYRAHWKQWE
ncbi:hypothetical protein PHYSODRAFT_342415 [Phytophthora sojae]|uniref:Reverse transcriptase domain-containing protein n=1 Tax=Phytophthora sojae (strain P6497) TaxID=1094619 RepID=G5AGB2_PHYSP|nr:hypothetical protein PHYSODRAFT_342415 [Phytophthora sojae]EGZ05624.1 hypothetical protein PHYSODRAFT_342415 [Phytophthora sojae]|eukprot:XP_009539155.1 hypothetical protein PHYSODRAFT_342415 [Phytophthora sojae]